MTPWTRTLRVLLVLCFALVCGGSAFAEGPAAPGPVAPPKVAVKALESTSLDAGIASALTDILCTRLAEKSTYRILCASDVAAILSATQQTALIGKCDDDACYEVLGKALESDYILVGSITRVGKRQVISLSLIHAAEKTTKARISHDVTGSDERLIDGIREAADKLLAVRF